MTGFVPIQVGTRRWIAKAVLPQLPGGSCNPCYFVRVSSKSSKYKWEATTLEGFVQQLAVGYVARRYFFYVTGSVPQRLDAGEHDCRMLAKFEVARSKWSRYRRRQRSGPDGKRLANVHYLRYRNFWVLLASAVGSGAVKTWSSWAKAESEKVT